MADIIGYRLISGEHVIGEVISKDDKCVNLKNAVTIDIYQTERGGVGINLTPLKYFSEDKDASLKNDHIMFDFSVKTDILNQYNKVFGSGLIVPKKEGLIY